MTSTLALSPADRSSDLDTIECSVHWRTATFTVEWDASDGPRREPCCDKCVGDTMRYALLSGSFTPPIVAPVDLSAYASWAMAS